MTPYSFRPASIADLPRLRRWLMTPEVARWWGDPRTEFEALKTDLNEPRMTMRIVSFRGRPFAYAQDFEVPPGCSRISCTCPRARERSTVSSGGLR